MLEIKSWHLAWVGPMWMFGLLYYVSECVVYKFSENVIFWKKTLT